MLHRVQVTDTSQCQLFRVECVSLLVGLARVITPDQTMSLFLLVLFTVDVSSLSTGGDDRRVLLWDMERVLHARSAKPLILKGEHLSNIFCLAFDSTNKMVFSGGETK